jgi:hypothetical protein
MAMSESERISRLLASGGRYLSNKQTRDSGEQTLMVQARASGRRITSDPSTWNSIRGAITNNTTTLARNGKNTCATVVYYSGSNNSSGYTGILQAAQKCAICSMPDYSSNNAIARDTFTCCFSGSVIGAVSLSAPPFPAGPVNMLSTTGAFYSITVPDGARFIRLNMWGAAGTGSATGGNGAYISGDLPITTGASYRVIVGRGGRWDDSIINYGQQDYWGGGGWGNGGLYSGDDRGDGGGRSAIQIFSGGAWVDVATAGGGGGASGDNNSGSRLPGGHAASSGTSWRGANGSRSTAADGRNGGGGGQTQGGDGGVNIGEGAGAAGIKGFGGNASGTGAGGAGGGWYGGGGGSGNVNDAGGGGGGSSYIALLTNFVGIDGNGNLSSPTLYIPSFGVWNNANAYGGNGLVYYQFI